MSSSPLPRPRRALVTGGTRGIGRAISWELLRLGHEVHVNFRSNVEAALAFSDEATDRGYQVVLHQGDVSDPAYVQDLFGQLKALGGVEILVNNAGITRDQLFLRMSFTDWREVMAANADSVFLCSQQAAKQMMRGKWGRIVSISSPSAAVGRLGQANYAASKAAIQALSKTMAQELARYSVTVNVVSPGLTDTEMTEALPEPAKEEILRAVPLGRMAAPEEIAKAVAFLVREEAGYLTGAVLQVNGGVVML